MADVISPNDVNVESKYQQFLDTRLASSLHFNTDHKLISGNMGSGQSVTETHVIAIYHNLYKVHQLQIVFLVMLFLIILLVIFLYVHVHIEIKKSNNI